LKVHLLTCFSAWWRGRGPRAETLNPGALPPDWEKGCELGCELGWEKGWEEEGWEEPWAGLHVRGGRGKERAAGFAEWERGWNKGER
jgi:hypothetical protein